MRRDPLLTSGSRLAVASLVLGLIALLLWIWVFLTAEFQGFDIRVNNWLLFAAAAASFGTPVTAARALRWLAGRGGAFRTTAILALLLGLGLSLAAFYPLLFTLISLLRA